MARSSDIIRIRSEFIEKVGLIARNEGLPKSAGRMYGLFIFDGQTVAFSELAEQLQVSRASVSSSVRILEDRGILKRVTRPGHRQDYFQLTLDPHSNVLHHARRGVRHARDEVSATADSLPPDETATKARIDAFARLFDTVDRSLEMALADIEISGCPAVDKD